MGGSETAHGKTLQRAMPAGSAGAIDAIDMRNKFADDNAFHGPFAVRGIAPATDTKAIRKHDHGRGNLAGSDCGIQPGHESAGALALASRPSSTASKSPDTVSPARFRNRVASRSGN
jgi:hypothetical protein